MLLHSLYAWPACSTCVCAYLYVCVVYRVARHAIKTKLVGLWAAKDFDFGQLEPLAGGGVSFAGRMQFSVFQFSN